MAILSEELYITLSPFAIGSDENMESGEENDFSSDEERISRNHACAMITRTSAVQLSYAYAFD